METLMAVGTLAVGLLFVGGTFMTGIYFATVSTERTIGSVGADEAFAKIRLFDTDLNVAGLSATGFVPYSEVATVPAVEFLYPSTGERSPGQYSWSALARWEDAGSHLARFVVFVCRATGVSTKYRARDSGSSSLSQSDLPCPVRVTLMQNAGSAANEAQVVDMIATDAIDERAFINDGTSLVDDATGQIYRVLRRPADRPGVIILDRDWTGGSLASPGGSVWVVPPPVSGGRNPLIGVYQRTLRVPGQQRAAAR
ncbi:MAG: hypothetical protein A2Y77_13820 [Planctomycetes bacterium RBG_13_62_9]|nr:MAG: hypothetical protein A2Y77_13820 [Planctomycetes bacterium RBG_13_62_9]